MQMLLINYVYDLSVLRFLQDLFVSSIDRELLINIHVISLTRISWWSAAVVPIEIFGYDLQCSGGARSEYHTVLSGVRVEVSEDPAHGTGTKL